jgi:hypothetical protein
MNSLEGDSTKSYLLTRYAREQVARQLPGELQLLEISPDSLIFQFASEVSKMLPVIPSLTYEVEKGFTLKGSVILEPDSLLVTGPDIYLDTLAGLSTRRTSLGILEKSYAGVLRIKQYRGFKVPQEEVNCTIELEKLTEVQLSVPLLVNGLPDSLRLQTFPQEIRVTGTVGLSNYPRIVPEAFRIEVDYREVQENRNRLQVRVVSKPEALNAVNIYPQTVEYLLSVK